MLPQAPDNAANGHLGRPQGEIFSMNFKIGQEYKVSPENYIPNNFYTTEYLHKIYGVEKIS
jgi:hypothetical protein